MASPVVVITNVKKKGKRVEVYADYSFSGIGTVSITFSLVNQDGTVLGPYPYTPTTAGKIVIAVPLSEGVWNHRITVIPNNGTDTATSVDTTTSVSVVRGFAKVVLPQTGGTAGVSASSPAADIDQQSKVSYSQVIAAATTGQKRIAAANDMVNAFGATPVLRIFRNNEEIVRVKYSGKLVASTDANNDVIISTPAIASVNIYKSADLDTGTWRFALQGYGPAGSLREILGSAGGPTSGKKLILSEAPQPGMGFASEFTFVVPRSIDGLT